MSVVRRVAAAGLLVASAAVVYGAQNADAAGRPAHIKLTLNRSSIPATGVLQPVPRRLHIADPRHQVANPYVVDPARPKVVAKVTDANGHPVTDAKVTFHSSGGATFGRVINQGHGRYVAYLVSAAVPGYEWLRASTAGGSVSSKSVRLHETFGALHTKGSRILDAAGHQVLFKGVNFQPSAPDPYLFNEFPPRSAYDALARHWRVRAVRAFLDLDQWMKSCSVTRSRGDYDPYYRQAFTSYVRAATERGIYVILVLGSAPRYVCDTSLPHALPAKVTQSSPADARSFWYDVATTFKNNPLVGFDLYNEPHDVSNAVWLNGGRMPNGLHPWTAAGLQSLYNAVRGTGSRNLVFAEGPDWATATPPALLGSGASYTWQTDMHESNVVYTAHYYSCQGRDSHYPRDGARSPYICDGITPPTTTASCPTSAPYPAWDRPGAHLARWVSWRSAHHRPIVEDEFGWPGNGHPVDACFIKRTIAFDTSNKIGWLAYHWTMWSQHGFGLARHPGVLDFRPTISGCPVFRALTGATRCS